MMSQDRRKVSDFQQFMILILDIGYALSSTVSRLFFVKWMLRIRFKNMLVGNRYLLNGRKRLISIRFLLDLKRVRLGISI